MNSKQANFIARGYWQQGIWNALLAGRTVKNPLSQLSGKAKIYQPRYRESLTNLLYRAEVAGYNVEYTPGPRGGDYAATYRLITATA